MGSIIDAEKLQNKQFIKRDWMVYINEVPTTIILQRTELEVFKTMNQFNAVGKLQNLQYTFNQIKVTWERV